jgi:hypothetical protein
MWLRDCRKVDAEDSMNDRWSQKGFGDTRFICIPRSSEEFHSDLARTVNATYVMDG